MRKITIWAVPLSLIALLLPSPVSPQSGGTTLYVSNTDPTCGGQSPCFSTIQAAVDAAGSADTVRIQAGDYVEHVRIEGKNNGLFSTRTEADGILIEADSVAPHGSVTLTNPPAGCSAPESSPILLAKNRFVTIRGLTITNSERGIVLGGLTDANEAVHIDRKRLFGNGQCGAAIFVGANNTDALITNNLIYGNLQNGIRFFGSVEGGLLGGPHHVIGNSIDSNGWNGISRDLNHKIILVNNLITANGTAPGTDGGRFGVQAGSFRSRRKACSWMVFSKPTEKRPGPTTLQGEAAAPSASMWRCSRAAGRSWPTAGTARLTRRPGEEAGLPSFTRTPRLLIFPRYRPRVDSTTGIPAAARGRFTCRARAGKAAS